MKHVDVRSEKSKPNLSNHGSKCGSKLPTNRAKYPLTTRKTPNRASTPSGKNGEVVTERSLSLLLVLCAR